MTDVVRDAAMHAYDAGMAVLPPRMDGSKRPITPWRRFERERPSRERVERWYRSGTLTGLGVVCGPVSGNLVMLEAEDLDSGDRLRRVARLFGLGDVMDRLDAGYLEWTPGGGLHWLLRCAAPGGNRKLARRLTEPWERRHEHDRYRVLVETREAGGFTVLAPSHGGVHPTGRPYVLLAGGFDTIPTVSVEERDGLWRAARDLDQLPRIEPPAARPRGDYEGPSIADQFNARTTWSELLERYGWTWAGTRGGRDYWCRPGKTPAEGHSATTTDDVLFVFSSSTPFEPERGYTRFRAYAVLAHGGDLFRAARAIANFWKATGQ